MIFAGVAAAPLVSSAAPEPSLPAVDALFRAYDRPDVAGASAVVIRDGQLVHAKGYGLANVEERTPAAFDTSFRLASVTKQFIGMLVAVLADRGLLRYDEVLTDFFPNFPAYGRRVTIEQLLHHTSGLLDYESLIPSGRTEQVSDGDVLSLLAEQCVTRFSPGTQYAYSNSGYVLLGLVVEVVTGEPLADVLRTEIFAPLGMNAAMYEGENSPIARRAFGYTQVGADFCRTDQSVTSATRGDGGIYASARDMLAWDGALEREALVSAATLARIFTPGVLADGTRTSYGFGWELGTYRGLARQSHTGSTIGFRTVIRRFPAERLTVVVLVNRDDATPWDLADRIADLLGL